MTGTEQPVTTAETPPAKAKPKPAKAKPRVLQEITGPQYRTLKSLAESKIAMTRGKIMAAAFNGNSVNMRPILEPLVKSKLVTTEDIDVHGKAETVFLAPGAGRKAAHNSPPPRRGAASHQPLPKVGGSITKEYNGKKVTVSVTSDGFRVGAKTYSSLTAAAKAVRESDMEVNGWAFFGLTK